MSGHNCSPSCASALFSVACMKETKGQGWTRLHDNRLTGSVAKGIGDRVAPTWGDKVMAWGDRKVTRWGRRWVTASDRLTRIGLSLSSSSVFLTVMLSPSVHLSHLSLTSNHTSSHLWALSTWLWQNMCVWAFFCLSLCACVYMRLCANMEVLMYLHVSCAQSHVFVAAFASVSPLLSDFFSFTMPSFLGFFELHPKCVYIWVYVCVSQRLTSFLFALLVLSHSGDVLKQPRGRHTYSCWQLRRTRGRKWMVLPSFHTPATSHTDSAVNHGKCMCVCLRVRAYGKLSVYVYALFYILHLLRITLHGCTNCLRSVVIFAQSAVEQCVLRVSGRHYSAWYGKGSDLSGPSHTQRLVQCSSSLPGRWRQTQ